MRITETGQKNHSIRSKNLLFTTTRSKELAMSIPRSGLKATVIGEVELI